MRLTVVYKVPVSVVVDLDDERITKVVIHDECIEDEPSDVLDEAGNGVHDEVLAARAEQIARNSNDWPAWQYS